MDPWTKWGARALCPPTLLYCLDAHVGLESVKHTGLVSVGHSLALFLVITYRWLTRVLYRVAHEHSRCFRVIESHNQIASMLDTLNA